MTPAMGNGVADDVLSIDGDRQDRWIASDGSEYVSALRRSRRALGHAPRRTPVVQVHGLRRQGRGLSRAQGGIRAGSSGAQGAPSPERHTETRDERNRREDVPDRLSRRRVAQAVSRAGTPAHHPCGRGAPGWRPNIHAHVVGRQGTAGPRPPRQTEALSSRTSRSPAPENVAAKRYASEKRAF